MWVWPAIRVWEEHVQSRGSPRQHGVCFSHLRLSPVRSPPHTTTCRVRAGMEACPGGCTPPGFETVNIYGNLGRISLVTSPFEHRGIAVGLYHSQVPHGPGTMSRAGLHQPGVSLPGGISRGCHSPTALSVLLDWCDRSSSGLRYNTTPSAGRPHPALQD